MSIITDTLWETLSKGEILEMFTMLLTMSVLGLILTPASLALLVFAVLVEKMYLKENISQYWLFCISAGGIGVAIYLIVFLFAGVKEWDLEQTSLMFLIHALAAVLVYGRKWKHLEQNATLKL